MMRLFALLAIASSWLYAQALNSKSLSSSSRLPLGLFRHLESQEQSVEISEAGKYQAYTLDVPINHFPGDPYYAPHEPGFFKVTF